MKTHKDFSKLLDNHAMGRITDDELVTAIQADLIAENAKMREICDQSQHVLACCVADGVGDEISGYAGWCSKDCPACRYAALKKEMSR